MIPTEERNKTSEEMNHAHVENKKSPPKKSKFFGGD